MRRVNNRNKKGLLFITMLNRRKQGIGHCITHCMHLILKQYRPTFRTGICAWYTNVHHRYNAGDLAR